MTRLCRFRLFMSFEGSKCRQILAYVGCRFYVVLGNFMAFLCRFIFLPIWQWKTGFFYNFHTNILIFFACGRPLQSCHICMYHVSSISSITQGITGVKSYMNPKNSPLCTLRNFLKKNWILIEPIFWIDFRLKYGISLKFRIASKKQLFF